MQQFQLIIPTFTIHLTTKLAEGISAAWWRYMNDKTPAE
jgi:hypothetical protein